MAIKLLFKKFQDILHDKRFLVIMRGPSQKDKIVQFMESLGNKIRHKGRVYLTGGGSAVLLGWREATIDIDIKPEHESDEMFRAIASLKDDLEVNVELASPDDFIPPLPGWEERSVFICVAGPLQFFHYDFYSQALSKIERGHTQDVKDVQAMFEKGFIEKETLFRLFDAIRPQLIRYPSVDPDEFEKKVKEACHGH